jgi:putative membrane protein
VLITLVVKAENLPLTIGPLTIVTTLLSLFAVVTVIQLSDKNSIISLRRTFTLFLISTMIWLFVLVIGIGYSTLTNNPSPKFRTFLFGGFLVAGFELVVINGVFMKSTLRSLGLAVIHPIFFFAIILPRIGANNIDYLVSCTTGVVMVLSAIILLRKLDKFRTKHGVTSLQLLHAFMKTWVTKHPSELETYFEIYSKNEIVQTKVFHFLSQGKSITLILPGIHPGPFYPVGSYNLSETIFQALNEDSIPMVLHGVGGHERNLPKNEYTRLYATKLAEFVRALIADKSEGLRGPLRRKFGNTAITILALGNHILAMISKAPYNSDDLDPKIINNAITAASEHNLDLALVDAHNSIDGENTPSEEIRKEVWGGLFDSLMSYKDLSFEVGYAD